MYQYGIETLVGVGRKARTFHALSMWLLAWVHRPAAPQLGSIVSTVGKKEVTRQFSHMRQFQVNEVAMRRTDDHQREMDLTATDSIRYTRDI